MVRKVERFWEGSASEVGVMGDSFEVRKGSKMWFQHAMLPAFGGAADILMCGALPPTLTGNLDITASWHQLGRLAAGLTPL